jgi:hypothetical protein
MNQKGFAVITGASGGLGMAFARELAGRHHNHPIEPLGAFASALRQSNNQYFGNFSGNIAAPAPFRCLLSLERTHLDKGGPKMGDPDWVSWRVQHRERVLA